LSAADAVFIIGKPSVEVGAPTRTRKGGIIMIIIKQLECFCVFLVVEKASFAFLLLSPRESYYYCTFILVCPFLVLAKV
jgi:hypothetical protein